MSSDVLDLVELSKYLQRDARELAKLAEKGRLPGRRVGNDWRFRLPEVNEWLEQEMNTLSDSQLADVESGLSTTVETGPLIAPLMTPELVELSLPARTAGKALDRLVDVANRGWMVYDPDRVLDAVRAREDMCSTALPGGVAVPHPRNAMNDLLGESLIAFGRTSTGLPFGGAKGQLTDLFFLILCRDERQHLQVLARMARMFQRDDFLTALRAVPTPDELIALIEATEREVLS